MNKNWLYRVLAMALIVMMAMPFAMAEEVQAVDDVQANAVEEVVASEEVALDGEEAVSEEKIADVNSIDFDFESIEAMDGEDVDKSQFGKYLLVPVDTEGYDKYKIVSYKSDKPKVAKIKKFDASEGIMKIELKDTGDDVHLKVKYKYKREDGDGWSDTQTVEADFDVIDTEGIKEVFGFWSEDGSDALEDKDDAIDGTVEVTMGSYPDAVLFPFAINSEDDIIDYSDEEDVDVDNASYEPADAMYTFKWSSTSVACFENDNGKKVNNKTMTNDEIAELTPVFYKPGNVKLTFTSKADKDKKVTVKFKVKNVDSYSNKNHHKAGDDEVYIHVDSAKYTKGDKLEVKIWVSNGGGKKLKGKKWQISFVDQDDVTIADAKVKLPEVAGKKGKTATLTFEGDDLAGVEPHDLRYVKLGEVDDEYTNGYDVEANQAE